MRRRSRGSEQGFTLTELLVVASLLIVVAMIGLRYFQRSRILSRGLATKIGFNMEVRRAVDRLSEELETGCEVSKPLVGGTTSFLVIRTMHNHLRAFYLREAADARHKPYELVTYEDDFSGSYQARNFKVLFGSVKHLSFTALSPGVVSVQLTLQDAQGREFGSLFQTSLKNLGSVDD